jgi:two-component system NtrC family sensor kinase
MRNPANAIVNAVEPLASLLPKELLERDHPVEQLIGVLRDCAAQIALLSRQLLGFRRPGELDREEHLVSDVIRRATSLLGPVLRQIELREDLRYRGTAFLAAPLVVQVLTNLLENGAHAAGAGGWIRVATRLEGERVILEISDSGPGVPGTLRERIFEPFFTTKPPGSGTGLGLTTCREIIQRHGGLIEVRGANEGSFFHLELPIRPPLPQVARARGGGHA